MAVPILLMTQVINNGNLNRHRYGGGGGGGGYDSDGKFLLWIVGIFVAAMFILFGFVFMHVREESRLDKLPKTVYSMPKGEVSKINKCYSGKHYYNCTVTFTDGKSFETDITKWPDEVLTPGNTLHWEIWTQGYRQQQYLCNAKKCKTMRRYEKGDIGYSEKYARGNQ